MLDKIVNRFHMKNLMTDEVHFHLTGAVYEQNWHYWAPSDDSPHTIYKKP